MSVKRLRNQFHVRHVWVKYEPSPPTDRRAVQYMIPALRRVILLWKLCSILALAVRFHSRGKTILYSQFFCFSLEWNRRNGLTEFPMHYLTDRTIAQAVRLIFMFYWFSDYSTTPFQLQRLYIVTWDGKMVMNSRKVMILRQVDVLSRNSSRDRISAEWHPNTAALTPDFRVQS
jgi:hypothetical protein